ncbi:MAG: Plasma membrane t-SNARE, secretory vesicle fusion [Icmadophila ericetorum]|nr:Plasma membrane t-SNARE, secretory vesicle fusion [Icmadophila ericetorum]
MVLKYNQGGYGQQAGNPYAQQGNGNPYAQQGGNPYAQQQGGNPYAQQSGGYGRNQGSYGQGDVELGQVSGQTGGYPPPARDDPMAILNECREVSRGIDTIGQNLQQLQYLQQRALDDPDASQGTQTNRELDSLSSDTMTLYRSFAARITKLKQTPGAGDPKNAAQVGSVDRKLKDAIQKYQTVDADFRKRLQAQMARQYRIVRPDASEAEVREACEDTSSTQVFSQALLQSDRRGQSQSALRAVQGRHEAIQKIEKQVIELAQLFEDMNALVVQQDPVVTQINEQAEVVHENVTQANTQLDKAVDKARSARRKKWICFWITVLLVLIIIAIIVIVVKVVVYQTKLARRPILTQALATAVLFATGDVLAQQAVEKVGREKHNFARTGRMALYGGAVFGPAATLWYRFLQKRVVLKNHNLTIAAQVMADQVIFASTNLAVFLTSMATMEGTSAKAKLNSTYLTALKANWMLWPAVQAVNFKLVPLHHRVLVVNVVAIGWNCYLSYVNSKG